MSRRAAARVLLAGGLVVGGFALASPAGAVDFDITCDVLLSNGTPLTVPQSFTLEATAPPEVEAGETFTVTIPARTVNLPAENSGITINSYTNLSTSYSVSGGAVVPGSASGGASISGSTITLSNPGPVSPGPLPIPQVTFEVTAGAAGTTIDGARGRVEADGAPGTAA
ncbi:MAG: hypothetical protein KatS3mg010_0227 [Acidimicrobiia bacterium]|nr:MAG: hypothetical protein KatS3mg010_0227 [Acidimicrobiia bacterium]